MSQSSLIKLQAVRTFIKKRVQRKFFSAIFCKLKTFSKRLEDLFARSLGDVLRTSSKRLQNVFTRRLEGVLEDEPTKYLLVLKRPSRHLQDMS